LVPTAQENMSGGYGMVELGKRISNRLRETRGVDVAKRERALKEWMRREERERQKMEARNK
jgi:hypothetical protein